MRVCMVVKYPPIQGGVSARAYWIARGLAQRGHQVFVVTNAAEVEDEFRISFQAEDVDLLEARFDNGGAVTVVSSGARRRGLAHVPHSNPYSTKLAALATEVIRAHHCEVVFSSYYEPYGVSAHLASVWTGTPHVVQHAGSDRGRLMQHPELATAYREMLRHATTVITGTPAFRGLGIAAARLARISTNFLPHEHFHVDGPVLDVDLIGSLSAVPSGARFTGVPSEDVPVIGVLGKVGEVKGSYDLVAALARIRDRGHAFTLLTMVGGTDRTRFYESIGEAGLGSSTWALPMLPHWRVPEFIRRCTAVAFLEREFPIAAHRPGVPREVMSCGTAAVISREIVDKQPFRDRIIDGRTAFVVEDPREHDDLAAVLESVVSDPHRARAIGIAGSEVVDAQGLDALAETYEGVLAAAIAAAAAADRNAKGSNITAEARALLTHHAPASMALFSAKIADILATESTDAANAATLAYTAISTLAADVQGGSAAVIDIVTFERDIVWTAVDTDASTGVSAFSSPSAADALGVVTRSHERRIPVRSNWVRVHSYPDNIEELITAVADKRDLDLTPSVTRCDYLFQRSGNLEGRTYRLGPATAAVLDMCDGSRSVAEIESALRQKDIPNGGLTPLLSRLVHEQVLYVW